MRAAKTLAVPVPAGEVFSAAQRADLARAVTLTEQQAPGLRVAVFVGELPEGRVSAEAEHAAAADPVNTVLLAIDPAARSLEIVTGEVARRHLDDRSCALAALSMTSAMSLGDVLGGIKAGLRVIGEHARMPSQP